MKCRLVFTSFLLLVSVGTAIAQTSQPEASTVQLAPIVVTIAGWDTGITVINPNSQSLKLTSFVFTSTTGEIKAIAGKSYDVPPFGRFSKLASEVIGSGLNGSLKLSVVGPGARKALVYQAIYSSDMSSVDTIPAQVLASSSPTSSFVGGTLEGVFTFEYWGTGLYDFYTMGSGSGTLSSLEAVKIYTKHTPLISGQLADGTFRIVTAKGDEIRGKYTGQAAKVSSSAPQYMGNPVFVVTGGTGRFVHASGTLNVIFQETEDWVTWVWPVTWTLAGTIDY